MKTLVLKAPSALSAPIAGTPVVPPFDPSLLFSFNKSGIVTVSGKVTQWTNTQGVQGAGGNLIGTPSANAPTPGVDGVVFAGPSSQFMSTGVLPSPIVVPAFTVIVRLKFSSGADVNPSTVFSAADTNGYAYLRRLANGTLTLASGNPGGDQLTTTATVPVGTYVDITAVFNGANSQIYINGTLSISGTTGSATMTSFRLGANVAPAIFLNGEVKNLNAYSRALSAAEIAEIRAALT